MWQKLNPWGSESDFESSSTYAKVPNNQFTEIRKRIMHCLDNDYDSGDVDVDHTLNIMREETEKWSSPTTVFEFNDKVLLQDDNPIEEFKLPVNENDELVGYCLRLERNNAYLMQMIEKFEQVSFKKKYSELLACNKKLQCEYDRLKNANSKVYNSYCDILEENKELKSENQEVKKNLLQSKQKTEDTRAETEKLILQVEKLKKENEINKQTIKDYRKSKTLLQKALSEREDEAVRLKSQHIATKLKLEKIENLVLKKTQETAEFIENGDDKKNDVTKNNKKSDAVVGDDDNDNDDTIALLEQKYKTKVPI